MPQKITFLITQTTVDKKTGGYSETWYLDNSPSEINTFTTLWMNRRAAMLPQFCTINGFRLQSVGGKGQLILANIPGQYPLSDVPQMALNCRCQGANSNNVKFFQLRGLPDDQVSGGTYQPKDTFPTLLNQFFLALYNGGFRFRAVDLSKPKTDILSIDATGAFVLAPGITFNIGDTIDLLRVRNQDGVKVSGSYYVTGKTNDQNGIFLHWEGGIVKKKGQARVRAIIYPQIGAQSIQAKNVTTRKVGRQFFQYRGRQTRR